MWVYLSLILLWKTDEVEGTMRKKIIYETRLIGNVDYEYVQQQMTNTISKWQNDGFEVEVHFAANNSQMVVLLLKYQMV